MAYTRMNPMEPNMMARANDIPPPSAGTYDPSIINAIMQVMNRPTMMAQGPGVSMETTGPHPVMGTGYAERAAVLAELQRRAKEAALRGDFESVDRINMQIQAIRAQQMQGAQ